MVGSISSLKAHSASAVSWSNISLDHEKYILQQLEAAS